MTTTLKATTRSLPGPNGRTVWVYQLGPFTSHTFESEGSCKAQATRHERRGLSPEFWKRHAKKETTR